MNDALGRRIEKQRNCSRNGGRALTGTEANIVVELDKSRAPNADVLDPVLAACDDRPRCDLCNELVTKVIVVGAGLAGL